MTETAAGRDPVEELAEEFMARLRRGERPSPAEYAAAHPELADEIRELFPALVLLEGVKPAGTDPPAVPPGGAAPDRLGDYRILREVARGGMGVVYEAVQESLGRHVALKVLPTHSGDGLRLLRFRREARAAARLHHTNIVPVFDVGCADGVHYYAMQFIRGQGLDEVLQELRRLRAGEKPTDAPAADLTASLADGLRSGVFPAAPSRKPESSALLAGPVSHYFRNVAGLGVQAADALAHAHAQRVLHRDVKPSNLLLDRAGTLWLTDFGLAKDDGDDLTRTGDLVGTLRYMAPERFQGVSDPRADVYALGVTLYELLTLRPAFPEADRARLVKQIAHDDPPRPRLIDPTIPRDLETVVIKAIEKEPGRRYASAAELADDLRRFLADRPLTARRASWREQGWRWCRRNPGVAASLGLAFLLLGGGVAGTSAGLVRAEWAREAEADQRRAAERERDAKEAARQEAVTNLLAARRAVDRFLTRVSESDLFGVPRMQPVRRQLLQDAAEVYQTVLRQHGDDPQLRQDAALAYGRYGDICSQLGRGDEAERALRRALAGLDDLAAEGPLPADARAAGIDFRLQLGFLLYDRPSEQEREYRRALGQAAALAADAPGEPEPRRRVAAVRLTLSQVLAGTNPGEAEALCRAAIAAAEAAGGHPADLAEAWRAWGHLHRGRQPAEAERAYRRAAAAFESLAADSPPGQGYHLNLAAALADLAAQLTAARKLGEAEAVAGRAVAGYRAVVAVAPAVPNYAQSLAGSIGLSARIRATAGRPGEAVAGYREAVAVLERVAADGRAGAADGPLFPRHPADPIPTAPPALQAEILLADIRLALAAALRADGRADEADATFRELLARLDAVHGEYAGRPAHRPALAFTVGRVAGNLLNAGRPAEAEPLCRRAVAAYAELAAESPDQPDYLERGAGEHFRLGRILADLGRPDEAAESFARAAPLYARLADAGGPRAGQMRFARASALNNEAWQLATGPGWEGRDPARAVAAATAATAAVPTGKEFWSTLGAAHYRAGEWPQATAALERSMQLRSGGDSFEWFFLAMVEWRRGERQKARQWQAKAAGWMAEHQPSDPELVRFRAEAAELIGRPAEVAPPPRPTTKGR